MANKPPPIAVAAIAIAAVLLTVTTIAALNDSQSFPLSGSITAVNVDLYSDAALTMPCTSLNVGTVSPGSTVTQNVWIKNNGTVPVTLTMALGTWNPTTASTYLNLIWNRQSYSLAAGANVQATLTLTVAASTGTLTTFSCDVTITGTQQ